MSAVTPLYLVIHALSLSLEVSHNTGSCCFTGLWLGLYKLWCVPLAVLQVWLGLYKLWCASCCFTGLWLGLPACLEEFDKLVSDFFKAKDEKRKAILEQAQELAKSLSRDADKESAEVYIKTMTKVLDKGDDFISNEIERVEKLKDGKVSDKKKEQLGKRLNILTSFELRLKDEL